MMSKREGQLVIALAGAHGAMKVLAEIGEECHREQLKRLTNEAAELLWPGDETMKVKEVKS